MPKKRCMPCNGSGKVMGGGMLMQDCEECEGHGKIYQDNLSYENTKSKIMDMDPTMTEAEADKLLEDALNKDESKRGRPKKDK